jgi:deoxyxylulose-5-phosphate synthase
MMGRIRNFLEKQRAKTRKLEERFAAEAIFRKDFGGEGWQVVEALDKAEERNRVLTGGFRNVLSELGSDVFLPMYGHDDRYLVQVALELVRELIRFRDGTANRPDDQ